MSLREQVEALPAWRASRGVSRDAVLALIPEGAVLVTEAEISGLIFDLPIGEDVTYSRGYSAGIAAARQTILAHLRASDD